MKHVQTDRQKDRPTDRPTDRQTDICKWTKLYTELLGISTPLTPRTIFLYIIIPFPLYLRNN